MQNYKKYTELCMALSGAGERRQASGYQAVLWPGILCAAYSSSAESNTSLAMERSVLTVSGVNSSACRSSFSLRRLLPEGVAVVVPVVAGG